MEKLEMKSNIMVSNLSLDHDFDSSKKMHDLTIESN
jgi:hypothetical protein